MPRRGLMASLVRAVWAAIVLVAVFPLLAFGLIAKDRWEQTTRDAEEVILRETAVAAEHIGRVLET